jgi:hypothetical protein
MVETKLNPQHGSMAERIANRLRNSGDVHHADVVATHGTGPTRTNTNIHHSRQQKYGPGDGSKSGAVR